MKSPDDLPGNATVEGEGRLMQELFGSFDTKIEWSEIKRRCGRFPNSVEVNMNTLKEISRSIWGINSGDPVRPVQGIIFVDQGPKRYRPIVNRVKPLTKDRISCEILLIEEVGGQLQNVDRPLAALITGTRMGIRIRWEVIRPFAANVRRLARLNARKLRFDHRHASTTFFLKPSFAAISPQKTW